MRKFLALTGSLTLIVLLGLGGWAAWPILFPSLPAGWLSTLAKADAALIQGRPDQARRILEPVPAALPVAGWLQWNKRVRAVASQTGDWTWAVESARRGQDQYPGNPDLAAVLTWFLLQDKRPSEALVVADKVLKGTPWETLAVQSRIEAEGMASGDWSSFRETLAQPDSQGFVLYSRLSGMVSDPGVRKNALLAALAEGRLDEARQHLSVLTPSQRDQPPFDRLQALMAYDQGDWNRAAALLRSLAARHPETLLVLADVYLHLGDPGQARIIYDQWLADHPDNVPPAVAINRATLALDQGDPSRALEVLGRALAQSPRATGVAEAFEKIRLLVLEARFRLGESESVRVDLDRILSESEETPFGLDAELLKGRLFPDWSSLPRLWSLLHRHRAFAPLAERLAWLLLVEQDYPAVYRVLDIHESELRLEGKPAPWWAQEIRALTLAVEDRLVEALDLFAEIPSSWHDATYFANWSLIAMVRARQVDAEERGPLLENALERLSKALDLLPPGDNAAALRRRSLWLTRRGELETALIPLQNPAQRGALRSAAAEDFRQAVQLDPGNLRASFLLRQALTNPQEAP